MEWNRDKLEQVFDDITSERRRQVEKWGYPRDDHTHSDWYVILGEEFGEVADAILEYHGTGSVQSIRSELVQVAAVACAHIEAIDRRG